MMNNILCPIQFGDCPDCEHYKEGECQYEEENNQNTTARMHPNARKH